MTRTWTLNLDRFHEILTPAEQCVNNTPNIKSSDENVLLSEKPVMWQKSLLPLQMLSRQLFQQ